MGVVHKLQDEVRDFIVTQKRDFPQISCRKLSDVVYEKFEVVVSKSSISSVLKAANLSSPVGRHILSVDEMAILTKKPLKKFKIPEQKKSQIFPAHKPQVSGVSPKNIKSQVKKVSVSAPVSKGMVDSYQIIERRDLARQEMSNLSKEEKGVISPQVSPSLEIGVKNAGAIFLKAIEWNLFGGSLLGKILKDELGSNMKVDFEQIADLFLLSEILGVEDINNFDFTSWNWLVGAFDTSNDVKKIKEIILKSAGNLSNCGAKLAIEIEVLLREVTSIKVTRQNGDSVFVQARSTRVSFDNVQSDEVLMISEAMRMVGTRIISNVHSAIFHCDIYTNDIGQIARFLYFAFSGDSAESIREISLYNFHRVELVKYNYCPVKSRLFILVLHSWEKTFPALLSAFKSGEPFASLKVIGKVFFYKQCLDGDVLKGQDERIRKHLHAVAISYSPTENPFAVFLTNAIDPVAVKKAVLDFLLSWPKLADNTGPFLEDMSDQRGDCLSYVSPTLAVLDQTEALSRSVTVLRQVIKVFCQQYFFKFKDRVVDEDQLMRQIYGLPAVLIDEDEIRCLSFTLAENDPLFLELKGAIERFNQQVLFDLRNRRILLCVKSSMVF